MPLLLYTRSLFSLWLGGKDSINSSSVTCWRKTSWDRFEILCVSLLDEVWWLVNFGKEEYSISRESLSDEGGRTCSSSCCSKWIVEGTVGGLMWRGVDFQASSGRLSKVLSCVSSETLVIERTDNLGELVGSLSSVITSSGTVDMIFSKELSLLYDTYLLVSLDVVDILLSDSSSWCSLKRCLSCSFVSSASKFSSSFAVTTSSSFSSCPVSAIKVSSALVSPTRGGLGCDCNMDCEGALLGHRVSLWYIATFLGGRLFISLTPVEESSEWRTCSCGDKNTCFL